MAVRQTNQAHEPGEPYRTEIILDVLDEPGALARIGEVLGGADVNIVTAAAFTRDGRGQIHIVVEDSEAALAVLKTAHFAVTDVSDVMSVTIDDQPGELGRYARSLADAGINITSLYIAGESGGEKELIVGVDRSPLDQEQD